MFNSDRYNWSKEILKNFKEENSLNEILLILTEEEAKKLQKEFKDFYFAIDLNINSSSSSLKKFIIVKK